MGIGEIRAVDGGFTLGSGDDAKKMSLGTLMMMLNLERTNNLDLQVETYANDIIKRNTKINQLTEFMTECRRLQAEGWGDGTNSGQVFTLTIDGVTKNLWAGENSWAKELGITWTQHKSYPGGKKPTDPDAIQEWNQVWETNISAIKSKIDVLNNDSQVENIKLQNIMEKRSNAFEAATQVMSTDNDSIKSILRNL